MDYCLTGYCADCRKSQRVLLKPEIRPSLRKALNDCPEIEEELEMQPKYRSAGIK